MSQPVNKSAPSTPASKTKPARKRAKASILSIAYPNACGIDIGATSHFVAVPSDRDDEPVREFPAFTADLERLVPDGQVKFPHPWPPQIPPGRTGRL